MVALQPGLRIDRYEVVRPLGQGGMAVVVEVRHLDLGTRHALKVLQVHAPWLHERLLTEGRIQASLRDSHVCRVTDVIRVGDAPGLVMELVDGPPLELLLANYQPNLDQIDQLARGILAGVRAAHAAGLVHRDLKPANILLELAEQEDQVIPKVADYGLAKTLGELGSGGGRDTTRSGATLGTPSYMAPEQFRNAKHADQRADLFSVGCILYELVTGMRPFAGETPLEVYENTSQGRFRPVHEVAPNAPGRMADAITRALAPKPDDRFPSCAAFLEAWCGDVGDDKLARAWEPQHLSLIRSLVPRASLMHSTASIENRPATVVAQPPTPTAIPDFPESSTSEESESSPDFRVGLLPSFVRRPFVAGVAGLTGAAGLSVLGLGAGFLLALLLGGLAAGLWWSQTAEPALVATAPVPEPHAPVEPGAPTEPEPSPLAPPEPPDERVRSEPAVPLPGPGEPAVPAPGRAPSLPAEVERPEVEPLAPMDAAMATVQVSGVERAWLIGQGKRFKPGSIPPGDYTVQVFFEPSKATPVMAIQLGAGERREITCSAALKLCN